MRGTQCLEFGAGAGGGLIPTYAGNTWPLNRRYAQPRAHPHVCGEHSSTQRTATRSPGSSPRVWGAPVRSLGCRSSSGLIPTCVGSTPLILITQFDIAAHPHVCGEHPNSHICPLVPSGSSPRVWGAHHLARRWLPVSRLIPTCVGSTGLPAWLWPCTAAHPHVCGEHF